MTNGISKLIRSWNRFYANFNHNELSDCIDRNLGIINEFKNRDINSLSEVDFNKIRDLFNDFLNALKRNTDNRKSAVSVVKTLSLLAPNFFPLWDSNIAYKYGYIYFADTAASKYILFCEKMKLMTKKVKGCVPDSDDRSLLKRIDEYNY